MKRLFTIFAAALLAAGIASAQDVETYNTAVETFNNGALALQEDNKTEALNQFKEALNLFQNCEGDEALEMVARCKEIIPSTLLAIAKDLINNQDYDAAIASLKETAAVAKEYGAEEVVLDAENLVPETLYRKASALVKVKDFANAIPVLNEVVAADSTNGQAYLYLGQALLSTGSTDEGIEALKQASANGKSNVADKLIGNTYLKKGQAALKGGQFAEAIEAINNANQYIENAQAYKLLASANMKSGKTADALEAYKKYLQVSPDAKDAADVIATIAVSAQKAGDKATAIEYYSKLENDPKYGATAKAQLATLKK